MTKNLGQLKAHSWAVGTAALEFGGPSAPACYFGLASAQPAQRVRYLQFVLCMAPLAQFSLWSC